MTTGEHAPQVLIFDEVSTHRCLDLARVGAEKAHWQPVLYDDVNDAAVDIKDSKARRYVRAFVFNVPTDLLDMSLEETKVSQLMKQTAVLDIPRAMVCRKADISRQVRPNSWDTVVTDRQFTASEVCNWLGALSRR